MPLVHVTLNTGHTVVLPAGMVHEETRNLLQPIIAARQGNLPGWGEAYRVEICAQAGVCAFTINRGLEPITLNIVCWVSGESSSAWESIERFYLALSDNSPELIAATASPDQPQVPWVATVLLPGIGLIVPEHAEFIVHVGACLGTLLNEQLSRAS